MAEFELVIPCYNEEHSLKELLSRAVSAAHLLGVSAKEFQLVLVNNGSHDGTQAKLHELQQTEFGSWFRSVHLKENEGYGGGIIRGLESTTAPIVGWTHADLQCDPGDALRAYRKLQNNQNIQLVKGQRRGRAFGDRVFTWVFEFLARLILKTRVKEINAQPKIFRHGLLPHLTSAPKDFAFDLYVLVVAEKVGWTTDTISVLFPKRTHGLSKWAYGVVSRYRTIRNMILYMWSLRRSLG